MADSLLLVPIIMQGISSSKSTSSSHYELLATFIINCTKLGFFPCRYNDSPDGDWMIGPHPSYHGLVLATAGSGHAFKVIDPFLICYTRQRELGKVTSWFLAQEYLGIWENALSLT